ncbi:MAG: hypothetical protein WBD20_03695 [Pirellulaceae bacterium]
MSTLFQVCPQCASSLELPADSVGRLAKCPACEATFRIGEETIGEETKDQPNAISSDEPLADDTGRLRIVQKTIEDMVAPTLAIFKKRWGPSVVACLIVAIAGVVVLGAPAWVLSSIAAGGGQLYAVIGVMLMIPYAIVLSAYGLVGLCRVHLAVARGEGEPLQNLRPPLELVMRFLPSYLLLFLVIAGVLAIGIGAVIVTAAMGQPQLSKLTGIIVSFVLMVIISALQWYLWAWMMAASDGKCTAIGSLKLAASITMQNKLSSFFVVIVAVVLSLVGSLACYVGHIVTSPLTLLLFAVGYLMMTNQPIDDPAETTV